MRTGHCSYNWLNSHTKDICVWIDTYFEERSLVVWSVIHIFNVCNIVTSDWCENIESILSHCHIYDMKSYLKYFKSWNCIQNDIQEEKY
jgi:hypothetical protein